MIFSYRKEMIEKGETKIEKSDLDVDKYGHLRVQSLRKRAFSHKTHEALQNTHNFLVVHI